SSAPLTLKVKGRAPGDYWLVLDTFDGSSAGGVDVTVRFDAATFPDNETCATADPLDPDGGRQTVDLSTAENDDFASCNLDGGPDVVYSVHLDQTADLLVTAVAEGNPGAGISPAIEVRSPDCAGADRLKCRTSFNFGPATVRLRSVPAGTYFVVL